MACSRWHEMNADLLAFKVLSMESCCYLRNVYNRNVMRDLCGLGLALVWQTTFIFLWLENAQMILILRDPMGGRDCVNQPV